jgi:ferredoxin
LDQPTRPGADLLEPAPAGRLKALLAPLHRLLANFQQLVSQATKAELNPFLHSGAVANTTFLIAVVTGILLIIWYRPSVHQAYDSVQAIVAQPLLAGWIRSLHRYSSDACLFFVAYHALALLVQRRFSGPRWLAWTSGVLLLTLLWALGWTGYWLIWDERGQLTATSTAKIIDVLPIFAEPLSRSFLTNGSVNSLFFFVIFFFHMLVPLAMGVLIWIHIARISRPNLFTSKKLTAWIIASLLLLCALLPADLAAQANLLTHPVQAPLDAWFLAPIWLIERLSAGAFWAVFLTAGVFLYGLPFFCRFLPGHKPQPVAAVEVSRCNACTKCVQDCPYGAISMVPRSDGRAYPAQASVHAQACVGCGICAGSCDSSGIELPGFSALDVRPSLEDAARTQTNQAFLCSECTDIEPGPQSGDSPLAGYFVQNVPCLGWIHPLTLERLIKRGVRRALLAGCGPEQCRHREGWKWTEQRMQALREPKLRLDRVREAKIHLLHVTGTAQLKEDARAFLNDQPMTRRMRLLKPTLLATPLLALMLLAIAWPSRWPMTFAERPGQLVVSFKHPGEQREVAETRSAEELAKLPIHMRNPQNKARKRAPVRLRIEVDGSPMLEEDFRPAGVMGDGSSVGFVQLPLPPGRHQVNIWLDDTWEGNLWAMHSSQTIELAPYRNAVVLFDRKTGFQWHLANQPTAIAP